MKRVVVAAGIAVRDRLRETILLRQDVDVRWFDDLLPALQALVREPHDLFVVHSPDDKGLPFALQDFIQRFPATVVPVVVLSDELAPGALPPFVRAVFQTGFGMEDFNDAVAEILHLPTRRCARLPLRIGLDLSSPPGTQIASTVNLSTTGMLVEVFKPLTVGKTYAFRFLGRPACGELPALRAKVLRSRGRIREGSAAELYALEFVGVQPAAMDAFLRSMLSL